MMKDFDYNEYTDKRQEILNNFDEFCDALEDRALNSFGEVDDERGIGDNFIKDLRTHKRFGGSGNEVTESNVNVPPAIFDGLCEDI